MKLAIASVALAATAAVMSHLAVGASTPQLPANTWASTGDMTEPRAGASAVLLYTGALLVTGGTNDAGISATAERYSPSSQTFLSSPPMLTARANHTSTLLNDGRALVAGGLGANGVATSAAELYDPATDSWMPVAPMHVARSGHTATALYDGRVVIAGGNDGGASLDSIEIYDPDAGAFTLANVSLSKARTGHAAARLYDGVVIVIGGFDGASVLSSVDLYNPFFDTLAVGPPLADARAGHSATTLLTGKVLVAGGAGSASELTSAEVYDPAIHSFSTLARSMIAGRQRHQAFLLPHNNQVLIVGGVSGGNTISTAEVYVEWRGNGGAFFQTNTPNTPGAWATGGALSFQAAWTIRSGPNDGLLLLTGGSAGSNASSPSRKSVLYGFATVRTDQADYAPGMTVSITGNGWVPGETVTLTLQESPGPEEHVLTAIADANGDIVNSDFSPDESDLNVLFHLTARGSASEAQTSFTDSLTVISGTVGGGASVTLAPSGTTTADVTLTTATTNWRSTGWRIATSTGAFTCRNTPDHNSNGTFSESFTVTAPSTDGTYNAYFVGYSDGSCVNNVSATFTLTNAVVVDSAAPTVTNVTSSTANGSYGVGVVIPIQVTFNKPAVVTGTPRISLETGSSDAVVNYSSGSGTTTLTFNYTVTASHATSDLDYLSTSALALNGGTIKDTAGANATLTLPAPGAAGSLGANNALVVETTVPTVTNVTSSAANGTYGTGGVIPIQVTFSEVVYVTATPRITLETGSSDTVVNYSSGSGTSTLTFTYTVPANDINADLDYKATSSLALGSGGAIQDAATNDATLTLPSPAAAGSIGANKNIVVDAVGSAVTDVTSSAANGSYTVGASLSIQVIFDDVVTVIGTPRLTLETGGTNAVVDYGSGSGSTTLTFSYTVAAGHTASDLNYTTSSALALNGGTITDTLGNAADLTLPTTSNSHSLGGNKAIVIDATAPTISNVTSSTSNGTYGNGAGISIQITFSEAVTVTGTPQLTLETGTSDAVVNYAGGSGSSSLTFTYTVAAGHSSSDLNYISTSALALSGGAIQDAVTNDATLTLPTLGGGSSLAGNKALVVDAVAPTVSNVSGTVANGTYAVGGSISVLATFSRSVVVTGTPQLTLETGVSDGIANYSSGSGSAALTFTYTVAAGHTSADLDYASTTALALNGGTIKDTVTNSPNNATLTLPVPGAAGSLSINKDLVVDGVAPTVAGVTASTANGSYTTGGVISIQVGFSEVVTVTGTPQLTLETGGTDAVVNYASGSGTTSLTFTYTVSAGETSSDLEYVSTTALALNGGTLKDSATNNATLTLAAPGASGSLGANKYLVIDTTAPAVSSINRTATSPTNASSVSWTVTFSESVTGIDSSDFSLVSSGLSGAPAVTGVSGSGASYTVTASTGNGSGALGLNLVDDDSVADGATNTVGGTGAGNGNFTGAAYAIDRTLTPLVTASGKTYDGAVAATILTRTLSGGLVSGDDVSLANGTATFDTKNAGSGKTVTATGLSLTGADAVKYVLSSTSATTTATITAAGLTVTGVTSSNKAYDQTTTATLSVGSAALVGVISGDTVALGTGSATGTFASASIGTGKIVTVAGLALNGADAGNYTLTQPTTIADITAKTLTVSGVTANNNTYSQTTTASLNVGSAALVGVISGDTVALGTGSATGTFASASIGTGKIVTVAGLALNGADAGNYTLTQPTTIANITPATLTPNITVEDKAYDGTIAATIATRSIATVLGTDAVSLTGGSATFDTKNVGTGKTVTATGLSLSGADAGNYTLASASATTTAAITAPVLTITAVSKTKTYGEANPTLTVSYAGFVNGDTSENLTLTPTVTTTVTGSSPVGTYPITASGAVDSDYSFAYVAGTLTVNPTPASVANVAQIATTPAPSADPQPATTPTAAAPASNGEPAASDTPARSAQASEATRASASLNDREVSAAASRASDAAGSRATAASGGALAIWPLVPIPAPGVPTAVADSGAARSNTNSSSSRSTRPTSRPKEPAADGPAPSDLEPDPPEPKLTAQVRTAIEVSNATATHGEATVTLRAKVTPDNPSRGVVNEGAVTFMIRNIGELVAMGASAAVTPGAATAVLSLRDLPAGSYSIEAAYDPALVNPAFEPSRAAGPAAGTLTIAKARTKTVLTSSLGTSAGVNVATFAAVVSPQHGGAPTGSVKFFSRGSERPVATVELGLANGLSVARFSQPAVGAVEITAVYVGDGNFAGSANAPQLDHRSARVAKSTRAAKSGARKKF